MINITLQQQPTRATCVQTCLAMAIGAPVLDVMERYGSAPMGQSALCFALTECEVVWNQMTMGTIVHEGWYFAAVPSLNYRGGAHQILIRWSCSEGLMVVDPAIDNKYKSDGSDLTSWFCLIPFVPGGILPPQTRKTPYRQN